MDMRVAIQIKTTFSLNLEIQTDILERAFIWSHWKKCLYNSQTNSTHELEALIGKIYVQTIVSKTTWA